MYDLFISYRRDGGEHTAKILHDALIGLGYRVFFDVESLRSGEFNRELFRVIEECRDFLVVLSPGALDRCDSQDDWVRLEVAYAIRNNKNIVPILLRGFTFPSELPDEIDALRWKNGIEASTQFFDAFVQKLVKFLKTKPSLKNRLRQNYVLRRVFPLCAALLLTAGLVYTGVTVSKRAAAVFPHTAAQQNLASRTVDYLMLNMGYANQAIGAYDDALDECGAFLSAQPGADLEAALSRIDYASGQIRNAREKLTPLDNALLDQLNGTPLPAGDLTGQYTFLRDQCDEMLQTLEVVRGLLNDNGLSMSTLSRYIKLTREMSDLEKDILYYGINDSLRMVSEAALKEMKEQLLPTMTHLYTGQPWLSSESEIAGIVNRSFNSYQDKVAEAAALVGNEQHYLDTLNSVEASKRELEAQKEQLAQAKAEAKEKFKPLDSDEPGILWGKMRRFHTLGMPDMALECLERYAEKDTSSEAAVFVPAAMAFFERMDETGITDGCLVCGFEPGIAVPENVEPGDILIAVNGESIVLVEDVAAAKERSSGDGYMARFLRFHDDSHELLDVFIPDGTARLALYDLSERFDEDGQIASSVADGT